MIVDYIDAYRDRFGVEPICRVLTEHELAIAPSTYWAHKSRPVSDADWGDARMANVALDCWRANRSLYGGDKLATAMRNAGFDVGRDQVARLMRILGIEGVRRGKHHTVTTRRDPAAARHPDLIKRKWSTPTRPDQWWVADFTYVWTLAGFVYTSFVTDVCSRRILGWRVSASKATPLVMSALEQALFTRLRHDVRFTSNGLVFHSDAGSQYTALSFTEALIDAGIAPSIGTVGDALDNALDGINDRPLQDRTHRTRPCRAPGADAARSNARPPAGSTGTTAPASTTRSRRCHPSSSRTATDSPTPPTSTTLPKPSLHQTQGDSL